MGTRADFYVGRGPDAEWLGSITWDGYPGGIDSPVVNALIEADYRESVKEFLAGRNDATLPTEFWPWPWEDSRTTDYAYAFEDGKVYASSFGYEWFEVDTNAENCGEPDRDDLEKVAVFPDMTHRMGNLGQIMSRSGLITASVQGDGLVIHSHKPEDITP